MTLYIYDPMTRSIVQTVAARQSWLAWEVAEEHCPEGFRITDEPNDHDLHQTKRTRHLVHST